MRLTTKRLILRDLTRKDENSLVKNINNINISKWLLAVPYPYTISDAKWWITHCKERIKEKPRISFELGIELKKNKGIIGGFGLSQVNRKRKTAEIGYWLSEKYWRKGFVSEASDKILDFAFNKLKIRKIKIPVFKENIPSNSFAKHLGAKLHEKKLKSTTCKATGIIHDENIYWLYRKDWKTK